MKAVFAVGFVLVSFAVGMHASLASAASLVPLTPAEIQARVATLQHVQWNGKSATKSTTTDDGCLMKTEVIQVENPVTQQTKNYALLLQAPERMSKPFPVIIIVPTIQGTREYVEPQAARNLCHAGYASIIADVNDVRDPASGWPAWGAEDANNRQALVALQTVVDFAERIPAFDKDHIGALGFSLGGITVGMFAEIEPRVKAAVTVVGGGNLPFILSHSVEPHVVDMREKRMKAAGLKSADEYDQILRANVTIDPFYFASMIPNSRVMMVMAEADDKVPYVVQQEQWGAFKKPQSITFTGGHVATILEVIWLYMSDITDFYGKRFQTAKVPELLTPITHEVRNLDQLGY